MKIGDFLKVHLKAKGMSQAELARQTGIPATTLSSLISRNDTDVPVRVLVKVCNVLECDINEYIDSLHESKAVDAIAKETKKIVPIETYKDEIFEQLNKLSYDELVELQQYLKFLQFKRDHPDEL